MKRFIMVCILSAALTMCFGLLTGYCTDSGSSLPSGAAESDSHKSTVEISASEVTTELSRLDVSKWKYDQEKDMYFLTSVAYSDVPADITYETEKTNPAGLAK